MDISEQTSPSILISNFLPRVAYSFLIITTKIIADGGIQKQWEGDIVRIFFPDGKVYPCCTSA
jgi:hypothetical protein